MVSFIVLLLVSVLFKLANKGGCYRRVCSKYIVDAIDDHIYTIAGML